MQSVWPFMGAVCQSSSSNYFLPLADFVCFNAMTMALLFLKMKSRSHLLHGNPFYLSLLFVVIC